MKKRFIVKHLIAAAVCSVLLVCTVQPAGATQPGPGISPELFQAMMRLAGFESTLQCGADAAYPCMVTVRAINNVSFTLAFLAGV